MTAQTQKALTHANGALALDRWTEAAFAAGARLATSVDPRQANYMLSAPSEEFRSLAKPLLAGLLRPKLSPAAFSTLRESSLPGASYTTEAQLMMHAIEPLVLQGGARPFLGEPGWRTFDEVQEHQREFFSPGNATIVVVGGFDPAVLRAQLSVAGGRRRAYRRLPTIPGTHAQVRSPLQLHVIGYPLTDLGPGETAAMRVLQKRLYFGLMAGLREKGVAYSVSVTPTLTPWFDGLMLLVPTFDESGLELEPYILELLSNILHRPLPPEELESLIGMVRREDEVATGIPERFVTRVMEGTAEASWLSPEQRTALDELTSAVVAKTGQVFFLNERRRFYVEFGVFK